MPRTCYMCERQATSREHVPPKCFFPEGKDSLSGKDLRKNLITVPSCELHNSGKSGDDLYLLHVIALAYQNNPEGVELFIRRIGKTIQSQPYLLETFFGEFETAFVDGQAVPAFEIDKSRFESGMMCMARAIYFAHFKTKWNESVEILAPSARYSPREPHYQESNTYLARTVEQFDAGAQKYGENQDIFYYQFIEGARPEHKVLRIVFYQGFVVLAIPLSRKQYILNNTKTGRT